MAGATGRARLQRANGPAQGQAQPAAGAVGHRRGGAGVVPEDLLRPECEALPREAERGARHPVELPRGAAGAARSGPGGARTEARKAPSAEGAPADGRDAAAHWWQQTSVVRGWAW